MRDITPKMSTAIWEIPSFQRYINPLETPMTKKQAINARVRLKVTTCLYLKRSIKARSLSTLIAVEVKTDIPHKIKPVTMNPLSESREFVLAIRAIMACAKIGCEKRPAKRSVTARHRNRSFVGWWREVSLLRATRIKAFPSDAVTGRNMLKAERKTSTPVNHLMCLFRWSRLCCLHLVRYFDHLFVKTISPSLCLEPNSVSSCVIISINIRIMVVELSLITNSLHYPS